MLKDRWQQINRIFHAALEILPEDRPGFLASESNGDPDLQREVERLLDADGQDQDYLESPFIPRGVFTAAFSDAPQLQPGDILCERFHILRTVGSGGMGQVFEAHDSELAVNVALKLIRPEIAANPQSLARFRQEVRLARRITHPNVCRTYDLDRDTLPTPGGPPQTLLFLTMEFLPGETLAERLKRAPRLTLPEIFAIAHQIARALDAAHALGIVHRDIKPANIMLVPPGETSRQPARPPARAVITDFGLARLDSNFASAFNDSENSVTRQSSHTNQPIGTLAYMAPEQIDGRPISAATDIYAFGLILFEMATGQRAFPSSNLLSGIAQRLTGSPPSPTTLQPDLPESIEQAIQGCLCLNPEDRFQSAQAVLECLNGLTPLTEKPAAIQAAQAIQAVKTAPPAKPQTPPQRHRFSASKSLLSYAAIAVLLAVSLFLLGERYSWWRGNPAVTAGALVYLAPVKNETGEKSLDNITALLQASLEQSAHINLLDQGRVGDILQNMTKPADTPITQPIGREIALRANAARVIFSSVTGSQGHYTLNIDIQRADYSSPVRFRDHWPNSFPWQVTGNTNSASQSTTIPQQLTSTLRNATDWIRKEVGESNNDIARTDDPPEDATTGSWEALQEFNEAIQLQHELKTEEAIQHLKQAVGIDPNFALAYGRLGDLEFSVGSSSAGLRSYARALDLTEIERLTARERDRIRGLAASDSGDFQSAVEAFRDYTVNYPQDYLGWFYLGNSVMMLGRKDEGIADMRNSYNRDPSSLSPAIQLGVFDAATGDFEGASELASKLRTNGASGYSAYLSGFSSFLEGKYDDAESNFAQIKNGSSPPGRTNGVLILEHLTAEQGRYAEALQLLDQGIVEDKQKGREADKSAKLIDRASIHAKLGNYARMLEDIDAALQADTNSLRIQSAGSILSLSLQAAPPSITVAIRERLRRLDREYSGDELGNYSKIAKFRIHAQALMASGDWESALIEARKASALDAPTADRSYLASILLSAANHQAEPAKKQALVNEAFHAYSAIVLSPGLAWDDWYRNPPGFLADEMTTFLDIASWLNIQDDDTQNVRNTLGLLRPGYAKSASQARRNSNLANTIQ